MARQKFLTQKIEKALEKFPLYSQEGSKDPTVTVKFFHGSFTWLITEYDGKDTFFGWTKGQCGWEAGYINRPELENLRTMWGYVERDAWFDPKPLSEARERL